MTDVVQRANGQEKTPAPVLLVGSQAVPKFNAVKPDEVQIFLALYRVESKKVDFVMTMNVPTKSADGSAFDATGVAEAREVFNKAAMSLNIIDFGLFA